MKFSEIQEKSLHGNLRFSVGVLNTIELEGWTLHDSK